MITKWRISGIDLAWGYRMPDAVVSGTLIKEDAQWHISNIDVAYDKQNTSELCNFLLDKCQTPHLIAIDAPLVCYNQSGSRPVDKECSSLYRQYEAGCHPVNLSLAQRPIELANDFQQKNVTISKNWQASGIRAIEVYPHPTMIHWFQLAKTLKYKKGKVAEKRIVFSEYQRLLRQWISEQEIIFDDYSKLESALNSSWNKKNEDIIDALFCLLIGSWEVMHQGAKSEILGDDESGFIVIGNR